MAGFRPAWPVGPAWPTCASFNREASMDFEKFSDRLKGFVQSAQTLAIREGNPQVTPEHLLKVLLDDPEGLAAGLITKAGGRPKEALERRRRRLPSCRRSRAAARAAAYGAGAWPRARPGRADRDQGRRLLRHRGAAAAGARHGQGGGDLEDPGRGRRHRER